MDTLGKRLKFYLDRSEVSVSQFAEKTGIPEPSVYRAFRSDGLNSGTLARIIESYPELNVIWLITGEGNIRKAVENGSVVNEDNSQYFFNNDYELKQRVKQILKNEVVLDVLVEILKRYDK